MCAALSPTPPHSSSNSSLSTSDQPMNDEKSSAHDSNGNLRQPAFLHSFENELNKVDQYFQIQAPDVRQAILESLQRMYHQNEWHDNPLTVICRDLEIHVPTQEQLIELKTTRDALKAEYDALRRSVNH